MDGTPTHAIELAPQREDIGYKKVVVWLGHDDLVPRRLELYEDAAEPKKRIAQSDVKSVGAIPVPHHVEVATPADDEVGLEGLDGDVVEPGAVEDAHDAVAVAERERPALVSRSDAETAA